MLKTVTLETMMNWTQLLNITRIRDLDSAPETSDGRNEQADDVGRTEYDRDYDRLIFSSPFKRLQDKAQVFPLEEHDGVRTRLTHSLEVSCVAKGLSRNVGRGLKADGKITSHQDQAIQTIASACALAHDLGNPPFGHAGEQAIVDWFEAKRRSSGSEQPFFASFAGWDDEKEAEKTQLALDFLRFDGNAHTQRLLSKLQVLSDRHGMNLTVATLASSCKYTAKSHHITASGPARSKKQGFFASEGDLMRKVFEAVGTNGMRHPIAHLVEAADDIVNRAADLEDGIRKRRLDPATVKDAVRMFTDNDIRFQDSISKVEGELNSSGADKWALAEGWASVFRTWAIGKMTKAATDAFLRNYQDIMNGSFNYDLIGASDQLALYLRCKQLVESHVFRDRTIMQRELMGRHIIHDLMDFYWKAISKADKDSSSQLKHFDGKVFELVSPNYRHIFIENVKNLEATRTAAEGHIPLDYYRMQLLVDQISGMTDSHAVQLHRELFNAY